MNDAVIGQPIDRVDGHLKVTGGAVYAAEADIARPAHAVIVQSAIARGRIRRLDTNAAESAEGVLAVITHRNMPRIKWPDKSYTGANAGDGERAPLSDDRVHYNGQHIAVVVAETFEQANYAASLIRVSYHEQAPTMDMAAGKTSLPKSFFGESLQHRKGDIERGLSLGAVRIDHTYTTPTETNNPMEPSATVAVWTGKRLTVYDATQGVDHSRNMLAYVFGLPHDAVRVIDPFVGGGFGCKGFQWSHTILAAVAARRVGRPVRLVLTRAQMFTSVGHRSRTAQRLTLAATHAGQLTAMRHTTECETATVGLFVEPCGVASTGVLYASPNIEYSHRLAQINIGMPTPMRAPGECPGTYALESAMDELAYALGMDPIELRQKNYADRHPIKNLPWSSKHLDECYRLGAEKFGWQKRTPQPRSMRDGDWLIGWGMASATYPAHRQPATARARIMDDGSAVVSCATQDLGTGSYTVFTQIAAQALGLPMDKVRFKLGDTNLPPGPISGGSTSAASVGPAVTDAARKARGRLIALAIADESSPLHGLQADQVRTTEGRLVAKSEADRGEAFSTLLKRNHRTAVIGEAQASPGDERGKYAFQSFGAQFVEVRVNPAIGRLRVARALGVFDAGRILNAKTAHSQFTGGIIMGIGMALFENTVYDPRSGQPVTNSLADYLIPTHADIGQVETYWTGHPDPYISEVGCRGIGEIGITGTAAAVANAVYHATGKRVRDLPITPDKLI